jgi:hypothetical protein
VDAFLQSLTHVLIGTTPAIDSVSVFLREGEFLRMRAVAGLAEVLPKNYTVRVGEMLPGVLAARKTSFEISHESPGSGWLPRDGRPCPLRHTDGSRGRSHRERTDCLALGL